MNIEEITLDGEALEEKTTFTYPGSMINARTDKAACLQLNNIWNLGEFDRDLSRNFQH